MALILTAGKTAGAANKLTLLKKSAKWGGSQPMTSDLEGMLSKLMASSLPLFSVSKKGNK